MDIFILRIFVCLTIVPVKTSRQSENQARNINLEMTPETFLSRRPDLIIMTIIEAVNILNPLPIIIVNHQQSRIRPSTN